MPVPVLGDRSLFPTLRPRVYLNHAAVSPLSQPVVEAARHAVDDFAAEGIGAVGRWMRAREALREDLAELLGVAPASLGFPPGTTRGIVDIALAIDWKPGDVIVVFEGEFPSNVTPWIATAARFGARVLSLPLDGFGDGSGAGLERVEATLKTEPVRLVAVSAVQFATGLRMPLTALGQLAHAHDAELFVDGVQALGALAVDLDHVDYLVAGTHKWWMSVDGLATAYASEAARARLKPLTAGWLSVEDPLGFLFEGQGHLRYDRAVRTSLDWMEGGVQTTAAFAGLHASVTLLAQLGFPAIENHLQTLHDALEPPLQALGLISGRAADPQARSGTLSFRPPPGVELKALADALGDRGVSVSTPDGWLRLSPHWPNGLHEIDTVVEATREALAQSPPRDRAVDPR
ncbi:MAG: aminotransferase class V-fold PLP-dependent enzyme [Myxococcota bacterium]